MNIPDDADGDAMRRVINDGADLTRPMGIDFMIACPTIEAAQVIAPLANSVGYDIKISKDEETDSVTCYCTRSMLLNYDLLIEAQAQLDKLAKPHGGYIDGWGTFGN